MKTFQTKNKKNKGSCDMPAKERLQTPPLVIMKEGKKYLLIECDVNGERREIPAEEALASLS